MSADVPFVPSGYTLGQRLGSGQTSHVFLSQHARFGRVALKLPRPELGERPLLRRMFENEVQITLKLAHARVVRGREGYPTGDRAYLALEYCSGGTLDQLLLERGRLTLPMAQQLLMDVAEGLAYTHAQRVLHRDVKPANVFLDADGRAKLGDFGTGVFMTENGEERVGTAFYMAPEIFEGNAPSVASDVYSLGVLGYEVLTGERPFRGETYDALMHAHLGSLFRDPVQVRQDLPLEVSRAVQRALNRDPSKRFHTVDAFLEALRHGANLPEPSREEPPATGRASRRGSGPQRHEDEAAVDDEDEERPRSWWSRLWRRRS